MVKDHYGRQKGNPLPPHVIPVVVHWLEREIVQWAKEKNDWRKENVLLHADKLMVYISI